MLDTLRRVWSADKARLVYETVYDIAKKFNEVIPYKDATELMKTAFKGVTLIRDQFSLSGGAETIGRDVTFPDFTPKNGLWNPNDKAWTKTIIAHELGHAWDTNTNLGELSRGVAYKVDSDARCFLTCDYKADRNEVPVLLSYPGSNEDWAMSFAQCVEPYNGNNFRNLGPLREQYVRTQIALLVTK